MIFKIKDVFIGIVVSKEDGIDSVIIVIVCEIEWVYKFGFIVFEYVCVKVDYLCMLEFVYNECNKVKNGVYVDEYVCYFIDNELILGIENEYVIMN